MKALTAVNTLTGEVIEAPVSTPAETIQSLALVNETIKALERLKRKLTDVAIELADTRGVYESGDFILRVSNVQRMAYDPAVLREVFEDEDLYSSFLEPVKGRIDTYIKEHLDELGERATRLRSSMVEVGTPYQTVRLEKVA